MESDNITIKNTLIDYTLDSGYKELTSNMGTSILQRTIISLKTMKQHISSLNRMIMQALRPNDKHSTIHVKHLHNSCQKLDNSSRKVFYLYVKGYSLNEITEMSGTKQNSIKPAVHFIMSKIHKEIPSA